MSTSIVDDAVVQDPFHVSKKGFCAAIHFLFYILWKMKLEEYLKEILNVLPCKYKLENLT